MKYVIWSDNHYSRMLFYDTNFLRALLKGNFHDHMADLKSDLRVAMKLPFRPWRTPFSFMEWIGLNSKSLSIPEIFDPASVAGTNFIEPAYHHYEKHYATVLELDRLNLENLAATQRGYVCPRMVDIWDTAMAGIFDKRDVSGWLRFALSFDAVHSCEVSPAHQSDYWSDLINKGFFKGDHHTRNLSKFRFTYQLWNSTRKKLTRRGTQSAQRTCIDETQRLLRLENWKDYLDGDLVHAATYGVEDPDGTRHRVSCLTCDSPEVVTMRIRLYKGLLSYVRKLYRVTADAEGCPPDYQTSHNGQVFCFDHRGNLVRRIDVASETPALPFLGKEPS